MASYGVLFVFSVLSGSLFCVDAKHSLPDADGLSRMKRKDETLTELSREKRLENDPSSLSRMKRLDDVEIHVGEPPDLQPDEKVLAQIKRIKSKHHEMSKMMYLNDEAPSLSREKRIDREPPHNFDDEKSMPGARAKHLKEERPSLRSEHMKSKGYGVHSPRREEHRSDSKDKTHHYNMDKIHQKRNEQRFHSKLDRKHAHFNHDPTRTHTKDKRSALPKIYRGDEGRHKDNVGETNFEARLKEDGYFDRHRHHLPDDFFEEEESRH